jgi:cyclic-di-GMP-binding protein
MSALVLQIPIQDKALARKVELNPKRVKAWIEALPLTQVHDAARKVLDAISAQNRIKVDYDQREELLKVQQDMIGVVFDELDALYSAGSLPLSQKARQAVELAKALRVEVGHTYKILITERNAKLFAFGNKKAIPPLLFGILVQLSETIFASYRSYTPVPGSTWKEFYSIYLHALREGIAAESVRDDGYTMTDLFVETCLVAVIDPYRATVKEIAQTRRIAQLFKGLATLHTEKRETNPTAHFVVPLDVDRPPRTLDPNFADPGGPNARLLDCNALVSTLRDKADRLNFSGQHGAGFATAAEQAAAFKKLILLWGDPPKRAFRRDSSESQVAICYGLRAVSHFVGLEPEINFAAEAEAIKAGITIPLISLPNDDVSKSFTVHEWEVVNQSAGGLKVHRLGTVDTPLTVGEVIGIKFVAKPRWQVGVIRWVSMSEDGGIDFGIQLLSPHAHAVMLRPTVSATGARAREALWLPEVQGASDSERLLVALNIFADLREYEVSTLHQSFNVRATALIERTAKYELFEFQHSETSVSS